MEGQDAGGPLLPGSLARWLVSVSSVRRSGGQPVERFVTRTSGLVATGREDRKRPLGQRCRYEMFGIAGAWKPGFHRVWYPDESRSRRGGATNDVHPLRVIGPGETGQGWRQEMSVDVRPVGSLGRLGAGATRWGVSPLLKPRRSG